MAVNHCKTGVVTHQWKKPLDVFMCQFLEATKLCCLFVNNVMFYFFTPDESTSQCEHFCVYLFMW